MVNVAKIIFRVDSSLEMGTGHVMRCLTLANRLRDRGADCRFISRALPGMVTKSVQDNGYELSLLPYLEKSLQNSEAQYTSSVGVDWAKDAQETRDVLEHWSPDWLIVDHYAFDQRWEDAVRIGVTKLMVIDDLADRPHSAQLFLDQNLGRLASDYDNLLPNSSTRMIGPDFALLRPEFAQFRTESLSHRAKPALDHIVVSMGGTDAANATGQVLEVLARCGLAKNTLVTVVMGSTAPFLENVRVQAATLPYVTTVRTDVDDMAGLMAQANMAIGAAGGTAWERCCLGLPTLVLILAGNQRVGAQALDRSGAALLLGEIGDDVWETRLTIFLKNRDVLSAIDEMSQKSRSITDGLGCDRVVAEILGNTA